MDGMVYLRYVYINKREDMEDKQVLNQILKELKELKEEINLLKQDKLNKEEIKNIPKEKYTGKIVTQLFSKFYSKVEKGLVNTKQEEFGRGCYDFYSNTKYLTTKQFDSLNRLTKDVDL